MEKHLKIIQYYDGSVELRINQRLIKKSFGGLKNYACLKMANKAKMARVQLWLKRGYKIEFWRIFGRDARGRIEKKNRADLFRNSRPQIKIKRLFYKLANCVKQKQCIKSLFLHKFTKDKLQRIYEFVF
jgi:hypothetical protein